MFVSHKDGLSLKIQMPMVADRSRKKVLSMIKSPGCHIAITLLESERQIFLTLSKTQRPGENRSAELSKCRSPLPTFIV